MCSHHTLTCTLARACARRQLPERYCQTCPGILVTSVVVINRRSMEAVGDGDGGLVTVVPVCLQAANVLALNFYPSFPAISVSVFFLNCPILH